jgi:hypothetical protein
MVKLLDYFTAISALENKEGFLIFFAKKNQKPPPFFG